MIKYFILSLILSTLGMKLFIYILENTNFLKKSEDIDLIKKPCIKELHKNKQNTLTMGGLVMNFVLLLMTLIYYIINKNFLWINIFIVLYGIMGFIDDYIKIKKLRDGVSVKEKLAGLTIISIIVVFFMNIQTNQLFFLVFYIFILVISTNSVNITDGLDGLALGISIIVTSTIIIISYQLNNEEVLYSGIMLLGISLGAFIFNRNPAKIFIGDTGALLLGGAMGIYLIKLKIPLWVFIFLIVCIWESLSVFIQVASIRFRGKKVFLIAPFHHHLEKLGWKEKKIVYTFWIITFVFCILGYYLIKF